MAHFFEVTEIPLTFLFSSLLLGILVLYYLLPIRKRKTSIFEEVTDPDGRKRVRIFEGEFERDLHDKLYMFGEAGLSNIVFIESMVPLQKSDLVKALTSLAKVNPLLRMRCCWEGSRRFKTEMDQFTVKEVLFTEEDCDDWLKRFEQDLQKGFDLSRGPLWRVVRIKESFDSSTKGYNNIILLSVHHSISDEISVLTFLDQLADILDSMHFNNFREENLKSLPLLPPLLELVKHHTHLSWWQKIILQVNSKLQSNPCKQYTFLDIFKPPLLENPSMIAKTRIIPGSLTETQTACLVKNCKANKCTVSGALGSCYAIAIRKMVEDFDEILDEMTLGVPVNTRKGCKPVVGDNEFGLFIGIVFVPLTLHNKPEHFWNQAQNLSEGIKKELCNNKQYNYCTLLQNGLVSPVQNVNTAKINYKYAGRYPNFELSNCGNMPFNQQRMYKIKRVHFAVAQDIIGPLMTISSISVSGQLHYSVIYCNTAIREEHGKKFAQLFHEALIEHACRKED